MPDAVPRRWPASMLRARALEKEREVLQSLYPAEQKTMAGALDVIEQVGWDIILHEFHFPENEVYRWGPDEAPSDILNQLVGQTIGFGMKVNYHDEVCLVVDLDIRPKELGQKMTGQHLDEYWRPITLVPLKYIDLET